MKLRKEIVKLKILPDCIKEFDTHIFCKYSHSGTEIDFYEDHIILNENGVTEKLKYDDINYINTLIDICEDIP